MMNEGMHRPVHGDVAPVSAVAPKSRSARDFRHQPSGMTGALRAGIAAAVSAAALMLGGCVTNPPAPAEAAPAVVSLEEWLTRGDAARKEGLHEASRNAYRDGAKAYPTDKQPWLRLADSYFQTGDYGNAVLAAQEAVQRDPKDNTAHSLLAVSGLRITAGSLNALREQSGYPVGSREEALDVTRRLREALSDPTLLTPVAQETPPPPVRKRPAARPPAATTATATTSTSTAATAAQPAAANSASAVSSRPAAQTPTAAAVATPAAPPKAAGNPLDKLK